MSIDPSKQMLRRVGVAPLLLSELPRSSSMRILPLPDLHIPASPPQRRLLLSNQAFLKQHDWVVLLGDITACYGTLGEYRHVRRFIHHLNRPYSVVNGNHEFSFLPAEDSSSEYGRRFVRSSSDVQCEQFERFEQFYGLSGRYQVGRSRGVGFCLLGVDSIGPHDEGRLDPEHEEWFAAQLHQLANEPLIVFSHFPLCDGRLDAIRYYEAGRKPYLLPSPLVRSALAARKHPTFWFSGHVHFAPSHPLSRPYQTDDGVWQIHCPDGRGYGRQNDELWHPQHHEGLFVRSILLEGETDTFGQLTLSTVDLRSMRTFDVHRFGLTVPARNEPTTPVLQLGSISHNGVAISSVAVNGATAARQPVKQS